MTSSCRCILKEDILKLLSKLSKNYYCIENTSDAHENFDANDETNIYEIPKNSHHPNPTVS